MFKTPFGRPASSSICTRRVAQRGVSEDGLNTIVFPQINAVIIFQAGIAIGKFHGVIRPQMPIGIRRVMQNFFSNSEGVVKPNSRLPSPAMYSAMSIAS